MMTLREYKKEFRKGVFSGNDIETMIKAGWHSWECSASELPERLEKIWELLEPLSSDYILDYFNVWFNNIRISGDCMADNIWFVSIDEREGANATFKVISYDFSLLNKYEIATRRNNFLTEKGFDFLCDVVDFIENWNPKEEKYKSLFRYNYWMFTEKMECCEERLFKESQTAYVRRTDYPVIIPKNTIGKLKEEAAFLEVWMEKEAEDEVCRLFVDYCRQALIEKERSFQQAKKRYEGTLEHFYTETSISKHE